MLFENDQNPKGLCFSPSPRSITVPSHLPLSCMPPTHSPIKQLTQHQAQSKPWWDCSESNLVLALKVTTVLFLGCLHVLAIINSAMMNIGVHMPMSSSRSFIVSGLIFRSLIHFEFIFVYGVRKCSSFILLQVVDQFFQHHLLKRLSLIHCIFCPPLSKIRYP